MIREKNGYTGNNNSLKIKTDAQMSRCPSIYMTIVEIMEE
jgi:hypothetical protein